MTFGLRNSIKQWFSRLKARTKRFYNNFPNGSSLKSVQTYLVIHTATYNLLLNLTTSIRPQKNSYGIIRNA